MEYKPPRDFECLKAAGKAVEELVMPWNDYSLKYVSVISNLCESGVSAPQITASLETSRSVAVSSDDCEEIYTESQCGKQSGSRKLLGGGGGGGSSCTWCKSSDGDHAECFNSDLAKKLDSSYWKCN